MSRASRQSLWQRMAHAKLTLVIGLFLAVFAIVSFTRELYHRIEVNQQIAQLQNQVKDLESRKTSLTNLIDYFQSPLFQEQEGREKLGLAKPGESVVVVPLSNDTATAPSEQNAESTTPPKPNPQKWWHYFFQPSTHTGATST